MATDTRDAPAALPEMTQDEYRKLDAVNQSSLKVLRVSPELYYGRFISGEIPNPKASASMQFGTSVEAFLRTGDHGCTLVPKDVLTSNGARRGKAWDEWRDAQPTDRELLIQREWDERRLDDIQRIATNVREHAKAHAIISDGEWHWRNVWKDEATGLQCKCEVDLTYKGRLLADLKTAVDTSPDGFARQACNLGYDMQAAYYMDAFEEWCGESLPFIFIVVRNQQPYDVECYRMDDDFIAVGRAKYRELLADLKRRIDTGDWKSATNGRICTLSKPRWYGA